MNYDTERVDQAVLALMYLNLHEGAGGTRAWKGFDWDSLDRLHQRGMIANPRGKARSVLLTGEGLKACKAAFAQQFGAV